ASWHITSFSFWLPGYLLIRCGPGILVGMGFLASLNELISLCRWERNLETALTSTLPTPGFSIKLLEKQGRTLCSYKSSQFPARRFFELELFRDSIDEAPYGHDLKASIYFEPDRQTPLAIKTEYGVLLIQPKVIGALRMFDYLSARWSSRLFGPDR